MKFLLKIVVLVCVLNSAVICSRAQDTSPALVSPVQPMADSQLDQLLGPIALYPDPLIAEILPAASLPSQIVLADRYVSGGGDPDQIAQQSWDASLQALAHYPDVLKWLDENLAWTAAVGQAYLSQPDAVMDSIQRLRAEAANLGNLQSNPEQQVIYEDGDNIEIDPADPQQIYAPAYDPDQVYEDPAISVPINFGDPCPVGSWLTGDFDWQHHHIIRWPPGHPRPGTWWSDPPGRRDFGQTTVWHPVNRPITVVSVGDRGYRQPGGATGDRPIARPLLPRRGPGIPGRPERARGPSRPESSVTYIGLQNSRDTRAASNRGRQSLGRTGSAPVHSEPSHSSGGAGGGHGGGGGSHR
jgi:hypothetical protein